MNAPTTRPSPYSLAGLLSPPTADVPFLHGLRAVSILMVFGFHLIYPLTGYMSMDRFVGLAQSNPLFGLTLQGHFGVDIFFVLSGFLIAGSHFREMDEQRPRLITRFFVKRAFRLLPAYYALLLVAYFVFPQHCPSIIYNIFYINNFVPMAQACVFWSWSLAIEEQFYLLFPFLALALFRCRQRHLLFVGILVAACTFNVGYLTAVGGFESNWDFANRFYQPTQFRFGSLVLGIYAAYVQRYHQPHIKALLSLGWLRRTLGLFAFVCFALPVFVPSNSVLQIFDGYDKFGIVVVYEGLYRYIFSTSIFLLILLLANDAFPWLRKVLSFSFYYPVSRLSYVIYLVHFLVIQEVYAWGYRDLESLSTLIPVSIGLTALATLTLFVFAEAPAMRARQFALRRFFPNPTSTDAD